MTTERKRAGAGTELTKTSIKYQKKIDGIEKKERGGNWSKAYSNEHLKEVERLSDIEALGETYKTSKNAHEETSETGRAYENPLHKFASYNTIFTLSGLSEKELNEQTYLQSSPHEIIARTGGVGNPNIRGESYEKEVGKLRTEVWEGYRSGSAKRTKGTDYDASKYFLEAGRDIFFESVNILSTCGPNAERGLANFQKMEFELHEPFGISLMEKVRAASFINGYWDYQEAPYLLTIEWKGWNEHGEQLHDSRLKRRIPIRIVRVEFDVDQGGARYQLIAVAAESMAFDDRFKYPRTAINITAGTYANWIEKLQESLDQQMEDEIKEEVREYADKYEFVISPEVIADAKELGIEGGIHQDEIQYSPAQLRMTGGAKWRRQATVSSTDVTIDDYTSLVKLFEDVVRNGFGYGRIIENFWWEYARLRINEGGGSISPSTFTPPHLGERIMDYLQSSTFALDLAKEENQYVNWFMIKPKFEVRGTGEHKLFDNIRKVHPKKITFVAVRTKIHVLKFIKPGLSFGNINWSSYVRRKYNYMYTGENVDIQNLKVHYKTAYYMRNIRPIDMDKQALGDWKQNKNFIRRVTEVFGQEEHPEPMMPLSMEPSVRIGKSTVKTADPRGRKNQGFYDYLTNPQVDMLRIELTILGDPAFICQDQFVNLRANNSQTYGKQGPWNAQLASFNAETYQPLILLNYRLPNDLNDKEGHFFTDEQLKQRSMWFAGIYQVVKVESRIEQGSFTQVLHCVRMNNQQGKGSDAKFGSLLTKYIKSQKTAKYPVHKTKSIGDYAEDLINANLYTLASKWAVNKVKGLFQKEE